jgi:hypothetical protein
MDNLLKEGFMHKKSLFFVSISVLLALLLITGCSNPTGSSDDSTPENTETTNPDGNTGNTETPASVYTLTDETVTPTILAEAFKQSLPVSLGSGVKSVQGVIPSSGRLIVNGSPVVSASLEVNGVLEIVSGSSLDASYTSTAGYLIKGSSGKIIGDGAIFLPYLNTGVSLPDGGVDYASFPDDKPTKTVGSVIETTNTPAAAAIDITALETLMGNAAITKLTVGNITGLTAAAIPANKELTLTGDNKVSAALNLASGGGKLIINGTLEITGSSAVTIAANSVEGGGILINSGGILDVSNHASSNVTGLVTNNGIIKSKGDEAIQAALLTGVGSTTGSGKVVLTGTGANAIGSGALKQHVEIGTGGTLIAPTTGPFTGGKTITITGTGLLDLGGPTTLDLTGVTIENYAEPTGGITTATTTAAVLTSLMNNIGGNIEATEEVAITEVPVGAALTYDGGDFAGGTTAITINGTANFATGTFEDQKVVIVGPKGNATFGAATFDALTTLTVNGTATIGDGAAAEPAESLTVSGSGTLNIGSDGLTIAAGEALTYTGTTIDLGADGKLILATATTSSVAGIGGTGTIKAGGITIKGTWTATAGTSTAGTVTLEADTDGLSITADGTNATGLAGGANGIITTGVENTLTIDATTTIDLNTTGGSLVIKGAATDGGKISLTAGTSVIKGGGSGVETGTGATLSKINDLVASDSVTTGADLKITGTKNGSEAFNTLKGDSSAGELELKVDVTIDKTTKLTFS